MPTILLENRRIYDEDCIYLTLVICNAVNYNKFVHTLFFVPILFLFSYYF